jgi:hypothetical protein
MPFIGEISSWYLRAWGNGNISRAHCQFPYYTEKNGFHLPCKKYGSGLLVARFDLDKDRGSVGIPFCRGHLIEPSTLICQTGHYLDYPELVEAVFDHPFNNDVIPYSPILRAYICDQDLQSYMFFRARAVVDHYLANHPKDRSPPDIFQFRFSPWDG